MKKLIFAAAFAIAVGAAFAGRTHKVFLPEIYGKVNGICTVLCSSMPNTLCTHTSTDGNYYQLPNCTTLYRVVRFQFVN